MIVKIIGSFMIIISTVMLGDIFAMSYIKRINELRNIKDILFYMEKEMLYSMDLVKDILYGINKKNEIEKMFFDIGENMRNDLSISPLKSFNNVYENYKDKISLNKNDISILKNFFDNLGNSNIESEIKLINLTVEKIKVNLNDAVEDKNNKVKIIRSLSFLSGIALVIILF